MEVSWGLIVGVSHGGLLGVDLAVVVETTLWRNLWGKGFLSFPAF